MPNLTNSQLEALREAWQERVSEFHASGQTQTAWCETNQIPVRQLRYWLRKFSHQKSSGDSSGTTWAPLQLNDSMKEVLSHGAITIRVGPAIIDIQEDFNPSLLISVIKTLGSLC